MNPALMNNEDVVRLCEKSKRLSGAKWKWQKICRKRNLTWQAVEESYDIIIKEQEDYLEKLRGKSSEQLGGSPGGASTDSQGKVPVASDGGDTSGTPIRRKKVRSRKAKNGSSTTGGIE